MRIEDGKVIILHIERIFATSGQVGEIDYLTGFAGYGVKLRLGGFSAPNSISGYIDNIAI